MPFLVGTFNEHMVAVSHPARSKVPSRLAFQTSSQNLKQFSYLVLRKWKFCAREVKNGFCLSHIPFQLLISSSKVEGFGTDPFSFLESVNVAAPRLWVFTVSGGAVFLLPVVIAHKYFKLP